MNLHHYLCQSEEVSDRIASLGYSAEPWDLSRDFSRYVGRRLIFVPNNLKAHREVHLASGLCADAGAEDEPRPPSPLHRTRHEEVRRVRADGVPRAEAAPIYAAKDADRARR